MPKTVTTTARHTVISDGSFSRVAFPRKYLGVHIVKAAISGFDLVWFSSLSS